MTQTLLLAPACRDTAILAGQLARAGLAVCEVDPERSELTSLAGRAALVIAEVDLASPRAPELLDAVGRVLRPPAFIVLTPEVPLAAKLHAYDAGADDVVVLPCAPQEVVARARALLRRLAPVADVPLDELRVALGAAVLDLGARTIEREGRAHNVRPKEYALLHALLRHRGEVVSREQLLAEVWGYAAGVTTRTVDTHVVRLRRLIERVPSRPEVLLTVAKSGYRLVPLDETRRS